MIALPVRRACCGLLALCSLAAPARAAEWEWRASGGAQLDSSSHGVFDLGFRKGPYSIQLYTDTVELRWGPSDSKGRGWIAARGQLLAAGLFISPWQDGAPDIGRSRNGYYGGADGGYVRYLGPIYAGGQIGERLYFLGASRDQSTAAVGPISLFTADLVLGHYRPDLHLWMRAGVDVQGTAISPHVQGELTYRPTMLLAPRLEIRAGWARDQTDIERTRLGGLNPYVVPLAGAAWAEWWVEDFAAMRLGLTLLTSHVEVGVVGDAAAFDGATAVGVAALLRGKWRRWFAEATVGYAPFIVRQEGISRLSAFVLVGTGWGRLGVW